MCALPEAIVSFCWPEDLLLNIQDVSIFTLRSMVYSVSRFFGQISNSHVYKKKVGFFCFHMEASHSFRNQYKKLKRKLRPFGFWFFA